MSKRFLKCYLHLEVSEEVKAATRLPPESGKRNKISNTSRVISFFVHKLLTSPATSILITRIGRQSDYGYEYESTAFERPKLSQQKLQVKILTREWSSE